MEELTEKQRRVLEFIKEFAEGAGRMPTVREIAKQFGITIGPVQRYLKALERKGALRHAPGVARGLELPGRKQLTALPVLGRVPAGLPVEPVEDVEDHIYVDREITNSGEYFALRVKGDSMTGAGIFNGDVIVVRRQQEAADREIVVAMVDGEATVKRLRRVGREVYLQPENPQYRPITGREITIVGKVVYLTRKLM